MGSQQNLGHELLLQALSSCLPGPWKQSVNNSKLMQLPVRVFFPLRCKMPLEFAGAKQQGWLRRGFAGSGAECSHLGDCSMEVCLAPS